jgi:hypothetical protein
MLLVLHNSKDQLLQILPDAQVVNGNVYQYGRKTISGLRCSWTYCPDQETGPLYSEDVEGELRLRGMLSDLVPFSAEEKAALIDRDTGNAISKGIHPFAGIDRQIGILREQLLDAVNQLHLDSTPAFTRLNEIALAAIEEGEIKKAEILEDGSVRP